MTHLFRIEDSNPYAKSIVAFLKTLDFVKEEKVEKSLSYPSMTEADVFEQALKVNEEVAKGQYISQEDLEKNTKKW
jgi:hypothetical protein